MSIIFDLSGVPTMSRLVRSFIAVGRLLEIGLGSRNRLDSWTSTPVLPYALEAIQEKLLAEHHSVSTAKLVCSYWEDDFL